MTAGSGGHSHSNSTAYLTTDREVIYSRDQVMVHGREMLLREEEGGGRNHGAVKKASVGVGGGSNCPVVSMKYAPNK
jgi:hypothetical protein